MGVTGEPVDQHKNVSRSARGLSHQLGTVSSLLKASVGAVLLYGNCRMDRYFRGFVIYPREPIPACSGSGIGFRGRLRASRGGGCLGLLRLFLRFVGQGSEHNSYDH
jgi:hypothetical protein